MLDQEKIAATVETLKAMAKERDELVDQIRAAWRAGDRELVYQLLGQFLGEKHGPSC